MSKINLNPNQMHYFTLSFNNLQIKFREISDLSLRENVWLCAVYCRGDIPDNAYLLIFKCITNCGGSCTEVTQVVTWHHAGHPLPPQMLSRMCVITTAGIKPLDFTVLNLFYLSFAAWRLCFPAETHHLSAVFQKTERTFHHFFEERMCVARQMQSEHSMLSVVRNSFSRLFVCRGNFDIFNAQSDFHIMV